jgi:hypothetical protein
VQKFYSGLLEDVQKSVAACTGDVPNDEVKISVPALSKFGSSMKAKFANLAPDSSYELPMLNRKGSKNN